MLAKRELHAVSPKMKTDLQHRWFGNRIHTGHTEPTRKGLRVPPSDSALPLSEVERSPLHARFEFVIKRLTPSHNAQGAARSTFKHDLFQRS